MDMVNQFSSFVEFEVLDQCTEIVKLVAFQQDKDNDTLKVEIFGKTNWMANQRFYARVAKNMEQSAIDNLNEYITLILKFDNGQNNNNQENALYFIKEGKEIMTNWNIYQMQKYAS
eukprot:TRINITY_DN7803_c0_g1_i1.p2 TRINITY_DN7803_c0_g1~~TRINITY_DN7803_c0_g1_i1.p2  ORF type:complete len:116 (-),score=24.95 TRINITY_DN7803_c0_g1_i1:92-439(-)